MQNPLIDNSTKQLLNHTRNPFCFLDDFLIVSKGDEKEHEKLVLEVFKKFDDKKLALKFSKIPKNNKNRGVTQFKPTRTF